MKQEKQAYTLARDFILPAGVEVIVESSMARRVVVPTATVLIAISRDAMAELTMPMEDALKLGFVKPK